MKINGGTIHVRVTDARGREYVLTGDVEVNAGLTRMFTRGEVPKTVPLTLFPRELVINETRPRSNALRRY